MQSMNPLGGSGGMPPGKFWKSYFMRLNFVAILTTTDIIIVVLVGELLVVVNLFEYWLLPTTVGPSLYLKSYFPQDVHK